MHLDERRPLLILAPLFRRTLAGCGHRNSAFFGHDPDRLRKRAFLHFHHKFKNITAHSAAEAMINLLHGMNRERRRLLGMKRAQAAEILPSLLQAHVFADNADDVRLLFYAIGK